MTAPLPIELMDAGLKATIVLGLAGLAARGLHKASAASRHLVWTLGVAAALLLPTLRVLTPRWELPLLPAMPPAAVRSDVGASPVTVAPDGARAPAPSLARPGGPSPSIAAPVAHALATPLAPSAAPPLAPTPARIDPAALLGLLWLAGAVIVAGPLVVGALRMAWLGRRGATLASSEWSGLVDEIAAALHLTRQVRLVRGHRQSMPMAWGLVRPVVLLPEDAQDWPEERRRAVLTHELAHVKRHDCLTQVLAHAACALYWFHPLVWIAARRLRVERERACDDLVLGCGASGPDYADHLLHLARSARGAGAPAWAAVAMARPSQLEGRLLAILDPALDRRGPSRRGALVTVAAAMALVVPLAGLEPWARPALAARPLEAGGPEETGSASEAEAPAPSAEAMPQQSMPRGTQAKQDEPEGQEEQDEQDPQGLVPTVQKSPASGRVVAALAGALQDSDDEVRKQAVFSLGELRAESAAPALAAALSDAEGEVRAQAAFALGELRASAATEALGKALRSDAEAEVRQQAAFALGQIRAEAAVPALAAALRDKEAEVRQQAVFALGQIRAKGAVPELMAAVKDADQDVREQAAFALGQIRAKEAVSVLAGALTDAQAEVREQAAFALGQIRSADAVPALVAALKDQSADVRQQAAFALGQVGDESASEALVLALKDAEAEVRRQAAFALGQLGK